MSDEQKTMDLMAARAALRAEEDGRAKRCYAEVEAILNKYGCRLEAQPVIQNGLILAQAMVVAAPLEE